MEELMKTTKCVGLGPTGHIPNISEGQTAWVAFPLRDNIMLFVPVTRPRAV
jgi:hypothetical protein